MTINLICAAAGFALGWAWHWLSTADSAAISKLNQEDDD